eukprot:TRINITY_DN1871_c0_g1_i1.p1 TRINITY_DN1871_c0_g1~~TRINITY_DN1871_c0_g1_i1.p1  ORF type:complete len:434 (+),score=168.06 TRINITY_DN1871_c0_g1_i1:34-1335(+)
MKRIKAPKNILNRVVKLNIPKTQINNFSTYATNYGEKFQLKKITTIHASKIKQNKKNYAYYSVELQTLHRFAESVTTGEVKTISKSVGDFVGKDELIITLETEKTDIEIISNFGGVVKELFIGEGDKVNVGDNLFSVDTSQQGTATPKKEAPKQEAPKQEAPKTTTAPKQEVPKQATTPTPTIKPPTTTTTSSSSSTGSSGSRERRVKLPLIRRRIADRLKDSQNTYALLTTFQECDMTFITNMRNRYKDEFNKIHGVKLGFMSAFVKASAYALTKFPEVNAVMDGEDIIYRDYVDISVAVATPKGLVVPVLRDVDRLSFAQIEQAILEYGQKAKENKLSLEEMTGGTFTISNGGVYGSLMGTPIVNPPQSAILGMHNIVPRPVVVDGKIEIRPMMYLALTYDHRIIDGKGAVSFLRTIKGVVEDPSRLLLDL